MKQKSNSKISAPTIEEIKASNACHQLKLSFDIFLQSKTKPESINEINQLIDVFETFLNTEANPKLFQYFSPIMIENIIDYISMNVFDQVKINKAFHFIKLIIEKAGVIFSTSSFMSLFLYLANGEEERFSSLKNNEKIVSDVFADEHFFYGLVSSSLFNYTFQKIYLNVDSKEICLFYNNLIFEIAPNNMLSEFDYQSIIACLQHKTNESVFPEIASFLTYLFSLNTYYKLYFNDKDNFKLLSDLLSSTPFDTIIECFKYLLYIEPPNFKIFQNILSFYQNTPRIQDQFFDWIFNFIKSNPEITDSINSIVPLSSWILPTTSISKLLDFMKLMNSINISHVSQFFSIYFSILCKEESSIDTYICGIGIIESQIFHRRISLTFLLNSLFLNAFIVKPSIDLLNEIFRKSYTFPQLVYDIYALPDAKPVRQEVLGKIIQVSLKNSELTSIVSAFLVISDSCQNIREMMRLIDASRDGRLCNSFCSAFPKSDTLTVHFLKEYGLNWIESIFEKKIIDIKMVKDLIIGLSSSVAISNIAFFIQSLPKNHPLFSLDSDDIRSIIYGCEDPPAYYPIKVYSLFHLIPCPWSIDPYNASVLGRNVLDKFDDLMNLPVISEIGNRYITDEVFYRLLTTCPTQLEQFADSSYDHFPLFQLFEFVDEELFEMNFKSISFWFRFASEIDESLKVPFFHTSKFNIFLKKKYLIANYEGTEYEVPINPLCWNHIFVSISSSMISHKIKIWVNLSKAVFTSPTKLDCLSNFGFLVYASYLFIGPLIRVYQKKCHEIEKIFELGPSSLMTLNEDMHITPSSGISLDRNMLSVPYYGFPEHFKSRSKIEFFFEIMKKTENEEDFDKLLSLYFSVFLIIKYDVHDLFSLLLAFFATIPERLTKDRFIRILAFFGKNKNQKKLLDEILMNRFFWNNVSNDIIIFSLVSYFKTFDFYDDIDKFQIFLATKILTNQTSKYIMTSFLVNSKALPKCQRYLAKLFVCHHFMREKESREVQCSIPFVSNNDQKEFENRKMEETCQYYRDINRRNVSVQCNICCTDNLPHFDEHLLLFSEVKNTQLQFTLINCFCDFIKRTENVESVKTILPMEDLLSLFIVSENKFKASLFRIFVLIEKMSPGYLMVNNLFLTAFFPLFVYQDVWDETMSLVSNDGGKTITNQAMLPLLLALIWSLTAASLHSISQTGKKLPVSFSKEISFCSSNSKFIASNKTAQQFFKVWYPLLLGFQSTRGDFVTNSVRLENVEIIPPKVSDFSHHIWKTVIHAAREICEDLPMKTDNFYRQEFREFVSSSELMIFLIDVALSSTESQIISMFSSFLLIPTIYKKDVSDELVGNFTTNCLTVLSQSFSLDLPFMSFVPILHYMSSHGLLKSNFQFVLSDFFVIMSLLRDLYNKTFKKVSLSMCNLMINLFENCDDESLHLLFNILQQNVFLFNDIVQLTNTTDVFLSFFQKVARKCYKEFDGFFKKFVVAANLSQRNKKVESLLKHDETDDPSSLSKWSKTCAYLASYEKQFKYEKNECYNAMMAELHENSKEFSLTYFISRKTQHNSFNSLSRIFESVSKLSDSQEYYNDTIKRLSKRTIESITIGCSEKVENIKLLPFSFPLSLPRLFVPTVVRSHEEVIEFIKSNRLYTTRIESFEALERTSLMSGNVDFLKNRPRHPSLHSISPQPSSLSSERFGDLIDQTATSVSISRKPKRANSLHYVASQPIPRSESLLLEEESLVAQRGVQRSPTPFNAVFSRAITNSPFIPYVSSSFQVSVPMISNCQLIRLGYSIPAIVSISPHNLRIIPFCKYVSQDFMVNSNSPSGKDFNDSCPCGNFPLEPEFVARFVTEVIDGFWGETTLYERRIVIKIPLNSIIFVSSKKKPSCFVFWTQKSGTFILDEIQNEAFSKFPFNDVVPLSSFTENCEKSEVVKKWSEGGFSNSQLIMALNICGCRNYVNLRNFILFPDNLSVFGTFLPINESLAANLTGLMIGHENYSNSIEMDINNDKVLKFIKKMGIDDNVNCPERGQFNFTFDSNVLCQKIHGNVPPSTLFDDCSIIKTLPFLSVRISQTYPFFGVVNRGEMSISIYDFKEMKNIFIYYSEDFGIAKSISVSQNYMFIAVDLENCITNIYQVVYEMGIPAKIEFVQEKSFICDQKTAITGSELIAGTFSGKTVYLWSLYRFAYHRIINFEQKVRVCQFDDNAGTFWVCDKFTCYLYDINGKLFSSYKFDKEITTFAVVPQPIYVCNRSAICGFIDGSVDLISPKIETGEICVKKLNHCHQSKIIKIAFHPQNVYFITIDNCQNAYFWTQKNVNSYSKEIDISIFDSCPQCGKKPFKYCSSCKRAFCSNCLNESLICSNCLSTEK